jgi:hypothetical protein
VSGTFRGPQSGYKYEDIVWEGSFEPCLSVRDNTFVVDLETFHRVLRVPPESPESTGGSDDSDPDIIVERKQIMSIADKDDADSDGDSAIVALMTDATEQSVAAMENGTQVHQQ